MGTKLTSTILLLISLCCNSQNTTIQLNEITLDSINLNNARYVLKDFGRVISQREWKEEYEDYSRNFFEIQFDSIEVLYYVNSSGKKFVNWIKVYGSNHVVKINNKLFKVNDSVEALKNSCPEVYQNYTNYLLKNRDNKELGYFGRPLLITNIYKKDESYQGELKFGIIEGYIKEIVIDLRPEGDYD
jgi:hypothetical protein